MSSTDRHLTQQELESLLFAADESEVRPAGSEAAQSAKLHLEGCAACQEMAKKYSNADAAMEELRKGAERSQAAAKRTADCPADEIWPQVATGLVDDTDAAHYVSHAAQCDWCGRLLRESMEDLAQDVTAEDQAAIARLPSAGEAWQREMAGKLAEENQRASSLTNAAAQPAKVIDQTSQKNPVEFKIRNRFGLWPRLAMAAAAMVVLSLGVWRIWLKLNPDPNKLLAEAYTEQRTIELRIAGAKYGPLRVERGEALGHQNMPAQLLEAELILSRGAASHVNDPVWLQAQARIALMEWDYESAIRKIDDALLLRPDDPALLIDRATALFERAEKLHVPGSLDYGEAADDLGRALQTHPDDPIALFNRAILYRKLSLPNQAVADLEHYLRVDPSGPWAEEAKGELQQLKRTIDSHSQATSRPLQDPDGVTKLMSTKAGLQALDERIEEYQDLAVREWLPMAFRSRPSGQPEKARAALSILAALLSEGHQDTWLTDLLRLPTSPELEKATTLLRQAVLSTSDDPMGAYAAAARAAHLFASAGSEAGVLRAQVEQVHDLQRAQQGSRCVGESRQLWSRLRAKPYHWIDVQLQIDLCGCLSKIGDFEGAAIHAAKAAADAKLFEYPVLELRASGLLASVELRKGHMAVGWEQNQKGLNQYWTEPYAPPIRAQQFYDGSVYAAEDLGYIHLAEAFALEDLNEAAASRYPSIEALVHSHLGKLEMQTGKIQDAGLELSAAHKLLAKLPSSLATRAYLADNEIDMAELEIQREDNLAARARLEKVEPELDGIGSFRIHLRFYSALAQALEREGEIAGSEAAYRHAGEIADANLQQLHDPSGRYFWAQETSPLFRRWVRFEGLQGHAEKALAIWEWYRAAAMDMGRGLPNATERLRALLPQLKIQAVIAYAILPGGLGLWEFDDLGVHFQFVEIDTTQLVARAHHFLRSCETPKSEVVATRREGRELYKVFMEPMQNWLRPGRLLVIEPAEELGDMPYQALMSESGSFVSESFRLIYSPGLFYSGAADGRSQLTGKSRALFVASPYVLPDSNSPVLSDSDIQEEARTVATHFASSSILTGTDASLKNVESMWPEVELFHYDGHAVATTEQEGLVLLDTTRNLVSLWSPRPGAPHLLNRCQLVVLAACATGTGLRGMRETHGRLSRIMLSSGIPHVLASQWNVDSVTTSGFMKSFYAGLLSHHDVATATSIAAAETRKQPGKNHPYYWAAFVVFGGGGSVHKTQSGGW